MIVPDLRPRPYRWARLAREAGHYLAQAHALKRMDPWKAGIAYGLRVDVVRDARWLARWLPFWR